MAKRHTFKKVKPGEPIPVTARQLESFMLEHNGRFNSRDYDKFERMKLMKSPVRDAIHELKTYSLETLAQRFDVRLFGRGKRIFARLDAEDDKWYYFSLAYIPRALNSLINRLEKGDLVEKDILIRNIVSNLEIDAQKKGDLQI